MRLSCCFSDKNSKLPTLKLYLATGLVRCSYTLLGFVYRGNALGVQLHLLDKRAKINSDSKHFERALCDYSRAVWNDATLRLGFTRDGRKA